jgi:hypothetical protein
VFGRRFDVDRYLSRVALEPYKVYRRGEPVLSTRPKGAKQQGSGFNLVVSGAKRTNVRAQIRAATKFIEACLVDLRRLRRFPGVEEVCLDFGVEWHTDAAIQWTTLPERLVTLAGRAGLSLEVTMYPSASRGRTERRATKGKRAQGRRTTMQ